MTKKDFSLMLGNIGDKYIVEAYAYVESHKRKFIPKRWIALAACIILIAAAFPIGIMLQNSGWFTPVGTGPITTAPTVVTDPPPSHVHEWGKWSLIRMATASEEGLEERVCECGEKETNAFPLGSEGLTYKLREKTEDEIIITGLGTCTDTDLKIGTYIDGYRVVGITEGAFKECTSLESIYIPDSVKIIEHDAFLYCKSLKSIYIPSSVKHLGNNAFYGCSALESVTIGEGITEISNSLFAECKNLKSITIPKSVNRINPGAFAECRRLKSVVIPTSVKSIRDGAFSGCFLLANIYFEGSRKEWDTIKIGSSWISGTSDYTIHCTDGDMKNGE